MSLEIIEKYLNKCFGIFLIPHTIEDFEKADHSCGIFLVIGEQKRTAAETKRFMDEQLRQTREEIRHVIATSKDAEER